MLSEAPCVVSRQITVPEPERDIANVVSAAVRSQTNTQATIAAAVESVTKNNTISPRSIRCSSLAVHAAAGPIFEPLASSVLASSAHSEEPDMSPTSRYSHPTLLPLL